MKKKIINGIMMVALVAATSTSFVSCKDTNEDVRVEMQQEYSDLLGKLKDLENKYSAVEGLSTRVGNLETQVKGHDKSIAELQVDVANLQAWAEEAFDNLVMSASIDAAYNNFTGSINIPGAEPLMLFCNYGTTAEEGSFPSENPQISWGANEELGSGKDAKIAIAEDGNVNVTFNGGFAGYLYASVNRFIPEQKLQDSDFDPESVFSFDLVDSRGDVVEDLMIANVEKDGAPTNDLLTWGWTRAENNMFKFGVAYAGSEASKYAPAKIDLAKFKDDLKAVWRDRNRATGTSKQALGKLAADLYYNLATKNTNLPKYRLRISWQDNIKGKKFTTDETGYKVEDNTVKVQHAVTANGNILFAAFKPLSFNAGKTLAENVHGAVADVNKVIEKSETLWNKIFKQIKSKFPNLNPDQINTIVATGNLTEAGGVWTLHATIAGNAETIDVTSLIEPLNTSLENVKDMLAQAKNSLDKLKGSNVTNWLEKFTNKFDKLFAKNAQQMLEPVLLAIDKDGNVSRVSGIESAPYEAKAGVELTLDPTSYSAEIFAPAYAKYIACEGITADGFNEVLFANDVDLKFTPEAGKTYEFVYEAVDFTGVKRSHTYYIQGK
jgi:hypothetical protein